MPAVLLKDVVGPDCIFFFTNLLFYSSHFFFQLEQFSGVILYPPVGVCQPMTWREISRVAAKWIFRCNRLKSISPSIEAQWQARVAVSV